MPEIYVSTDVEADGPIPGLHSMLSFAASCAVPTTVCADSDRFGEAICCKTEGSNYADTRTYER